MPGLSVHAVDVARGIPAKGMRVEVFALAPKRRLIAEGDLAGNGALEHAVTSERLPAGPYEVLFHAERSLPGPRGAIDPPFFDVVPFRFTIADPVQHYHLPMKITPWGFSLYRGS